VRKQELLELSENSSQLVQEMKIQTTKQSYDFFEYQKMWEAEQKANMARYGAEIEAQRRELEESERRIQELEEALHRRRY
jgi:polyhydroxyalkanoate synthesis regulator phasin